MDKYIILSSPLLSKIWGSNYFKDKLHISELDGIGEMWSVSAYPTSESVVLNGIFKDQKLSDVYSNNKELFNNPKSKLFPILVKIIAASDNLSIQVHPDDTYAGSYGKRGKTEGWLILDAKDDSSIYLGHHANSKQEIEEAIDKDCILDVLNKVKVTKGEFYPINAGTIHALTSGIVIAEVQQSSDETYRIYDYNRVDKNGNKRELHINRSKDVINPNKYDEVIHNCFKENINTIWDNNYFNVNYYKVNDSFTIPTSIDYQIVTVVDGMLELDGYKLTLGNSFIVFSNMSNVTLKGKGNIIITKSKE